MKIRSFFLLQFFLTLLSALNLQAQVTLDAQRPFNQGQVIEVPGTSEYLGDLSQEIEWESQSAPFHTIGGVLAQQVGFGASPVGSPAILFEGIPYPFFSSQLLNWLPAYKNFELLNFPASAWWGPQAVNGAIQIHLPQSFDTPKGGMGAWGGSGGLAGGEGSYGDSTFSAGGNFQHGFLNGSSPMDNFNFVSGERWLTDHPLEIKSGFLGAQWLGGDNWYSFFSSLKWESPDFQSLEWKPFFQSAGLNGINVMEFGSDFNYHLTMAGLVESQLGFGLSHDNFSPSSALQNFNRGYVQNFEAIDVLGDFKLNMAFRFDFSSVLNTSFSTALGVQYRLGDLLVLGDFSKGVEPTLPEDILQGEAGFRYQPGENWSLTCKYVYEQFGTGFWNGGRGQLQWHAGEPVLWLFKNVDLTIAEQCLTDTSGTVTFDTGGQFDWSFFEPVGFWVGGRDISGQNLYGEAGISCAIALESKFYVSVENVGNFPLSWPDPVTPQGRVVWIGAEAGF